MTQDSKVMREKSPMSELKKMMGSMEALVEVEDLEVGPGQEGDLEDPQHILL